MEIGELGMVSMEQQEEGMLHYHLWDLESWRDCGCIPQAGSLSTAEFLKMLFFPFIKVSWYYYKQDL